MNQQDDWMEMQLRSRRIESVPDAGFSARITARLPSRRSTHRWIVPTLSVIGALLTALTVPRAELSAAAAWVAEPEVLLVLALAVAVLVWIGSVWVLLDRRHRAL